MVFSVKGNYYRPVLAIVFRPLINYAKSIGKHQPHDAIAPAA